MLMCVSEVDRHRNRQTFSTGAYGKAVRRMGDGDDDLASGLPLGGKKKACSDLTQNERCTCTIYQFESRPHRSVVCDICARQ
jgi:hypothetical protein